MKDAQTPDHISLDTLVGRLREGRYVIPDFQREFEWNPWDIRELVKSIFLDYYIGSLLLWKGKRENFDTLACEPIHGYNDGQGNQQYIVLDGQQRLTAMYYVFFAPNKSLPKRNSRYLFFIRVDRFMAEAYDEAFEYDWKRRGVNLLADSQAQFENHMFPISIVGQSGWDLPNWVQDYEKHWLNKEELEHNSGDSEAAKMASQCARNANAFGQHLKAITNQYQIAFIELDSDLAIDKVCDIFTQINSRGIRLDIFDLVNALLKPKNLQLKLMWREAKSRLEFVDTPRMNVYLLQVMSILLQAYCSPKYLYYLIPGQERQIRTENGSLRKEVLVSDITHFEALWTEAVDAIESAIELLRHPQEFGAISGKYLPYVSILPAFAALNVALRKTTSPKQLNSRSKLRQWYWASVFTNRYSGAVESTTARDYLDVKSWFDDDTAEPSLIADFRARFANLDLHRETKRGTSVYNGIFNLLILNGARDWRTGTVCRENDLDDHHIVPKNWGKDSDLGTEIDSILNRSPLTADTNRTFIRDRLPNEYIRELIDENGESNVLDTMDSHFISQEAVKILLRDPFTPEDFKEFVSERQKTLQNAVENLLIKDRLDLSLPLRKLDLQIEEVELALRNTITKILNNDLSLLPSHVKQRIGERVSKVSRREAAFDEELFENLENQLEYSDLRDLHDTIVNNALWQRFETLFVNKKNLERHFEQLIELRNGIRHSRTVDEITRMNGEAATLWFLKVL